MDMKEARKRAGMNQEELAQAAGLDPSLVSRIESGQRPLTLASAIKFAGVLDVPPKDLLVHNQGQVMQRRMDAGDVPGVLHAAKSIVRAAEGEPMTAEGERCLDELVNAALKFTELGGGSGYFIRADGPTSPTVRNRKGTDYRPG